MLIIKPDSKESEIVNPYTQAGRKAKSLMTLSQASRLPDGNHPGPLGSGIIAGTLGEGGMARVYKIWNQKLELYRAVKVLLPTENPELMGRFETEIKISAKLHHPNIVETYVVGDWNGLPYIEMELVDGITIEKLITESKKVPPIVCVAIGIQVASALAYAHTENFLIYGKMYTGIIHRDLKPANIMIGKNGVSKLMDFGIARPSEVGLHTVGGGIFGTLPYLSPEQLDEGNIDHRSDIYSLGTILYEALTGEKTFPQQSISSLMRMKVFHSYKKFNSFSIAVAPEIEKAIEKCLYQDKNKRFATSKEFEVTLREIFKDLSSETPEVIIKQYVENPSSFVLKPSTAKNMIKVKGFFLALKATFVITVVGVIAVLLFVISVLKTDKSEIGDKNAGASTKSDSVYLTVISNDAASKNSTESADKTAGRDNGKTTRDVEKTTKVIKPATSGNADTKKVPAKTEPVKPALAPILSPVEVLGKKYNRSDIVEIADAASKTGDWNDVIVAINNMPANNPKKLKGSMLLAWAYVEQGKIELAAKLLGTISSEDAFYVLLEGRIASIQKKDKLALDKFEEALTRPSTIFDIQLVRSDALYYAAITYDNRYNATRSPEARQQAMIAWNSLKRVYTSRPDHSRFILSNKKLASF